METKQICIKRDCEGISRCQQMCQKHYNEYRRNLRKTDPTISRCSIDECERPILARSWCAKHYDRWLRNGDPLINFGVLGDDPILRFWQRVNLTADDSRCWVYPIETKGDYPKVKINGKTWKANRFVWFLTHGYDTPMIVRHACDNPHCVNPKHLLEGTKRDNAYDAMERGRNVKGETHGMSKLKEHQVREIRALVQQGTPLVHIAPLFNIRTVTVASIRDRRTWKHVE